MHLSISDHFSVIAALNQLHLATNVVNAVLYAALAAAAGIAIVAVGGGGISPMRARWENVLDRYDAEKPAVAAQAKAAPSISAQASSAQTRRATRAAQEATTSHEGPGATRI